MMRGVVAVLATAIVLHSAFAGAPAVPQGPAAPLSEDCFAEVETGTGPDIACQFRLQPSASERAELETGSRGYVKDFACQLTVRIARAEIDTALAAADTAFKSPKQPVVCTITTYKSTFDVTGTFAPEVIFKNGVAISATPGLGNVAGITRVISWPVVQFVNRWPSVRAGMLTIVNAYKAHKAKGGSKKTLLRRSDLLRTKNAIGRLTDRVHATRDWLFRSTQFSPRGSVSLVPFPARWRQALTATARNTQVGARYTFS